MINNLLVINQLFEIQSKIKEAGNGAPFERNFNRLFAHFQEEGYVIQDPTGEAYTETRTDCEASITGKPSDKMKITKTLKPVVYQKNETGIQLVQKAVVIAGNQ